MPDFKISQLNNGNPAQTADQIPINRAGVNFSITAGSIASLATTNSADTEVLFNDGGTVNGDPSLTFNKISGSLNSTTFNTANGIYVAKATATTDQTIAAGDNAMSVGPFVVASGVTITVSSGSTWAIV